MWRTEPIDIYRRPNYVQFAKSVHIMIDYITMLHVHQVLDGSVEWCLLVFPEVLSSNPPWEWKNFYVLCHVFFNKVYKLQFRVRVRI